MNQEKENITWNVLTIYSWSRIRFGKLLKLTYFIFLRSNSSQIFSKPHWGLFHKFEPKTLKKFQNLENLSSSMFMIKVWWRCCFNRVLFFNCHMNHIINQLFSIRTYNTRKGALCCELPFILLAAYQLQLSVFAAC